MPNATEDCSEDEDDAVHLQPIPANASREDLMEVSFQSVPKIIPTISIYPFFL